MKHQKHRPGQPRPPNLCPPPAPGALGLVQAFLNTLDAEVGRDELGSPQDMSAWLVRHGLLTSEVPIDTHEWKCAHDVRAGLRAVLRSHNGFPLDEKAVDQMNRAISKTLHGVRFTHEGFLRLAPVEMNWAGALSRILDGIVEALTAGHWDRFRACFNSQCQWAFFDASKSRSGKWCSVKRCGNRVNSRTYRKRGARWRR